MNAELAALGATLAQSGGDRARSGSGGWRPGHTLQWLARRNAERYQH